MRSLLALPFIALILFSTPSCIPQKKLLYLQDKRADITPTPRDYASKSITLPNTLYHIKIDDVLSVEVFSLTQEKFNIFNSPKIELTVDKQGDIELPVIGRLKAQGLTTEEIQEKIRTLTLDYLKSPTVHVKLVNFSFTVLGEVLNQGSYTTQSPRITVLEALGRAGGLTDFANRTNIRVVRTENGKVRLTYLNLLEDNVILSDLYYLQPDDVVIVAPSRAKNIRAAQSTISFILSIISVLGFTYVLFRR